MKDENNLLNNNPLSLFMGFLLDKNLLSYRIISRYVDKITLDVCDVNKIMQCVKLLDHLMKNILIFG